MTNNTPHGRALAIAASISFTIGGLTILLGDVILKPAEWTSYHALTVLTVFGTVAAGHLMFEAARSLTLTGLLAALGFLGVFLSGTGLVVYQSVGRQAETTDTAVLSVEATNKALAEKGSELAKARQRLSDANDMVDKEAKNKRCGQSCNDWKLRVTEVSANVKQIEGEIAKLGPAKPVAPKAEKMAAVAELFGADKAKAKAALTLAEPFLWTLFFEIGSIVSLGFAFRRIERKTTIADADTSIQWSSLPSPAMFAGPKGSKGGGQELPKLPKPDAPKGPKVSRRMTRDEVLTDLMVRSATGRTFRSQEEAARHYGVSPSRFSEWSKAWEKEGDIPARRMVGRCKQLVGA